MRSEGNCGEESSGGGVGFEQMCEIGGEGGDVGATR